MIAAYSWGGVKTRQKRRDNNVITATFGFGPRLLSDSDRGLKKEMLIQGVERMYTVVFDKIQACGVFRHSLGCDQSASEDQTGKLQTCIA